MNLIHNKINIYKFINGSHFVIEAAFLFTRVTRTKESITGCIFLEHKSRDDC